jgi:double-stranded uracil-DNA glycosylase
LSRRPSKAELEACRGRVVADLLPDVLSLLIVGINPSLWTAAVDAHFARPGNRFWPALHRAGLTPEVVDASEGMPEGAAAHLAALGVGITNFVPRATARADELTADELRAGGKRLRALVAERRPRVVAVLGLGAFRVAYDQPRAVRGPQPERWEGAEWWVLPNPSGLNAHESLDSLAAAYGEAAAAARSASRALRDRADDRERGDEQDRPPELDHVGDDAEQEGAEHDRRS